jgi:hypothetical protein
MADAGCGKPVPVTEIAGLCASARVFLDADTKPTAITDPDNPG